jgi:hypothetical protein
MYKINFIILVSLIISGCASNDVYKKGEDPRVVFPKHFFVEKINAKSCSRDYDDRAYREFSDSLEYIGGLLDPDVNQLGSSTSLVNNHDSISSRWVELVVVSNMSVNEKNEEDAKKIVKLLAKISKNKVFLDTVTLADLKFMGGGGCYDRGLHAKCNNHSPESISNYFSAFLFSVIVLDEYIGDEDRVVIDEYIRSGYDKYIKPQAYKPKNSKHTIYGFGDGGLGVLAYANYTKNKELLLNEVNYRRQIFSSRIDLDGNIQSNSYRGVRSYWYHTLGVDSVLTYSLVAREHGIDFFKDMELEEKFKALTKSTLLGQNDLKEFNKKGWRGDYSLNDEDSRLFLHQNSKYLPLIIEKEFGVTLEPARRFYRLERLDLLGKNSGIDAACLYDSKR